MASGLATLLWLAPPSSQTLEATKHNLQVPSKTYESILPENLVQITNFNDQGCLEFQDKNQPTLCLKELEALHLNLENKQKMKSFLTNKWIQKSQGSLRGGILPLWDQSCVIPSQPLIFSPLCPMELHL